MNMLNSLKSCLAFRFKSRYIFAIKLYRNYATDKRSLFENAINCWKRIAIEDKKGNYTYGEIYSKSVHVSYKLKNLLDAKQENVALLLPNDVSYIISLWAIWRSGHVAVPLQPTHPPPQLKYFTEDSQSRVIITNETLASEMKSFLSDKSVIVLDDSFVFSKYESQLKENKSEDLLKTSDEQDTENETSNALIIYTSGTSGSPKGVVLTHANLQSQIQCLLEAWGWSEQDVLLHCLPLHHVHGIVNALLCPLACGARVCMEPMFNARSVWSKLINLNCDISSRVSIFMAVPTIYAKLIEEYERTYIQSDLKREFVKKICMENIRLMISGSAPLPVPILKKWNSISGHTLLERYGMTEIGMALSNPLKGERTPGFVGTPLPGVQVKIVLFSPKRDSYRTICEGNHAGTTVNPELAGEVGELLVKGPNVFREYWGKEELTRKEFTKDGWFCTGDTAAFIDGKYKILGRTSVDVIKCGGFKVSALDVETHLLNHPNIVDVAVFGIPDMTWGEKIVAVIVWKGLTPFNLPELKTWAKKSLPHYQVPSAFKVLADGIPRNNMGKVNKKELAKQYLSNNCS